MANDIKNEYQPSTISKPGLTILDLLEEKGWTQTNLASRMGRPINKINEIIKGKISITPETAIQLERVLGVPSSFWNNRQKRYDEFLANEKEKEKLSKHINWLKKFPINEITKLRWIEKKKNDIEQISELLNFLGISSPDEWSNVWMSPKVSYKQSQAFTRKPEANSVWLRKGELEAQNLSCGIFERNQFIQSLKSIRELTTTEPEYFENIMVKLCANAGVALIFIQRLKGLPVYGITKWINPKKAMIQLSLYRKYEDYFWFTFFHEAAHIILHGKKDVFIENDVSTNINIKEKEANNFARDFLVPKSEWEKFVDTNTEFNDQIIIGFAHKVNISPSIIVGRLQRENRIGFSKSNHLRRKFTHRIILEDCTERNEFVSVNSIICAKC